LAEVTARGYTHREVTARGYTHRGELDPWLPPPPLRLVSCALKGWSRPAAAACLPRVPPTHDAGVHLRPRRRARRRVAREKKRQNYHFFLHIVRGNGGLWQVSEAPK
jgi:hypothetical protein